MSYLSHLQCSACGKTWTPHKLHNLCPDCQKPLLARYRLNEVQKVLSRDDFRHRPPNIWRYRELLPVADPRFELTLGEGVTPLIRAVNLGQESGFENLYIKDEGVNPTGSFKARGQAVAVSRARELGATALSLPSAGNAAGAMSAYAALAGLPAFVFMPQDVPKSFITECRTLGAEVTLVKGFITDCGKVAAEQAARHGRFDLSTLKEPYRLEGKKTMGYELAEQFHWNLPDVIIYPTGGGTGLVGMWKAFEEMEQLGWIGKTRPRMVSVQPEGCAPIVQAFHQGKNFADFWSEAKTLAEGLRVPAAVGDFLILKTLRESRGTAVAVSDDEMLECARWMGRTQGLFVSPESGATLAAFRKLRQDGWIQDGESVVLFNTGSGYKYSYLFE
ncbi:MAG: threonine synthase [Calditrichia bacterium]